MVSGEDLVMNEITVSLTNKQVEKLDWLCAVYKSDRATMLTNLVLRSTLDKTMDFAIELAKLDPK